MESRSNKRKGSVEEVDKRDRLGELPDEVLVYILSFMPTIDAIRTMRIRRFGNLWTFITSLDFDTEDFKYVFGKLPIQACILGKARRIRGSCFNKFVHNVMKFHRAGKIHAFRFKLHAGASMKTGEVDDVHIWIQWAVKREPENVYLDFNYNFPLPLSLLNSQSLVKLVVVGCVLKQQIGALMGSVKSLALRHVTIDDEDLSEITSAFPILEDLTLDWCQCSGELSVSSLSLNRLRLNNVKGKRAFDHCFNINCPNLKTLDFGKHVNYTKFTDLSSVIKASVNFPYYSSHESGKEVHKVKSFLELLKNTEILKFKDRAFQQLTLCSQKNLGFPVNRWKKVSLRFCHPARDFMGIYILLKNTPCLKELSIHVDYWMKYEDLKHDLAQELSCPCVAPLLKVVHIYSSKELDDQLHLILAEYLLNSAVVLDKIVFTYTSLPRQLPSCKVVEIFSSFPRASPKARVLFK